ncbi:hypothetical protein BFQ28_12210 [Citrobacter freundii]|nr:hypothetical protein BFQ28_12210 [Citrobacter freundii]
MIYGVHENHSVKRSGQAGGAAHAEGLSDNYRPVPLRQYFVVKMDEAKVLIRQDLQEIQLCTEHF